MSQTDETTEMTPEGPTATPPDAADRNDHDAPAGVAFGLGVIDLVVVALAGAFVLAFVPPTMFPSWTPRMAILVAAGLPGVVVLVWQTVCRDRAAVPATGFLAIAIVGAVVSHAPRSSLVGFAGRDLSVVMVAACFGLWALARETTERGRALTVRAFTAAASVMAAVGLLQVVFEIRTGSLALLGERPMSFMINPVYFGAVSAAAAVTATASAGRRIGWWHLAAGVAAAASIMSGSRVAWGALMFVLIAQLVVDRSRDRLAAVGAAGLGVVAAVLLDQGSSGGTNTFDRVTDATAGGGGDGRLTVWRYALESWTERPVFGHGVGLFRPAIQGRFTNDFIRETGLLELERVWFDAHNIVIAVLVSTGVIGLLLVGGWAVIAALEAHGPAAWGAFAVVLTWMMQPASVHTLPITMILLGVAMPALTHGRALPARARPVAWSVTVVAVLLAAAVVIGDLRLKAAVDDESYPDAVAAARWFPGDSVVASVVAQVARRDSPTAEPNRRSLEWRRRAVDREPDRPFWWTDLAAEELQLGNIEAAEEAVERALALQPANFRAQVLLLQIAAERDDRRAVEDQLEYLCGVNPAGCDITADDILGS